MTPPSLGGRRFLFFVMDTRPGRTVAKAAAVWTPDMAPLDLYEAQPAPTPLGVVARDEVPLSIGLSISSGGL
jgi:hypothetical protein